MNNKAEGKSKRGHIYLTGAGPGDPGLITCRGWELLQGCDAVVYDDLIPLELVVTLPSHVRRHYVGKRVGQPSQPQEETNRLLVRLAKEGLAVVRLKGGDPSVFGRLCEETAFLTDNGIEWTIIPGVTAASAAAADAGFSLTDRSCASWLLLGTGSEAVSDSPPVPWRELGSLRGGTLVAYMGISSLERLVGELLAGGMPPTTPVSIQRNVSRGDRLSVSGRLDDIVERCRQVQMSSPALIIISDVVARAFSGHIKPLAGKTVLVTRPAEQTEGLCRLIRQAGGEPLPYPTIQMTAHRSEPEWIRFAQAADEGGWLVFTSEMGVLFFFQQHFERGFDLRTLGRFRTAVVGEGTRKALAAQGIKADVMPQKALVAELSKDLAKQPDLAGRKVIRVRGNLSDRSLEDAASQAGADVVPLLVYETHPTRWESHWIERIAAEPPAYILFTSGSTFTGFLDILGVERAKQLAAASRIAAIGPITRHSVEGAGLTVQVEAEEYNAEGIVKALCLDAER